MIAAACMSICSCSNDSKTVCGKETSTEVPLLDVDGMKKKFPELAQDYQEINDARIARAKAATNIARPKNASSFGRKVKTTQWPAFDNATYPATVIGTVTVDNYEKGIVVTLEGQSWYYPAEGLIYLDTRTHLYEPQNVLPYDPKRDYSAAMSGIAVGEWEPCCAHIIDDGKRWRFQPAFTGGELPQRVERLFFDKDWPLPIDKVKISETIY